MQIKKQIELRDIEIELSSEEITALRSVIKRLDQINSLKDILDKSLPDEIGWRGVKLVIKALQKEHKYLTQYSRKRKYNTLPVDFVFSLIIIAVVHQDFNFDLKTMQILVELNIKMKKGLSSVENT